MPIFVILVAFLFSTPSFGFTLISNSYRLSNPSDTTVNIASGACRSNGVPDSELRAAIDSTINWWNEIPGSQLILKMGSEVSRSLADTPIAGEVLVGCRPLGAANGITTHSEENGSATISLNGNTLVPGGYLPGAIESTLVHEMGHALGLHHSNDRASVMTYQTTDWFLPSSLSEDDKDGVRYLYPVDPNLVLFGGCTALASQEGANFKITNLWHGLSGDILFILLFLAGFMALRKVASKGSKLL